MNYYIKKALNLAIKQIKKEVKKNDSRIYKKSK